MSFLDREHTVAPPGFNRWLVPPAALAVHLSIGQIYGYSVFNKPLSRLISGDTASIRPLAGASRRKTGAGSDSLNGQASGRGAIPARVSGRTPPCRGSAGRPGASARHPGPGEQSGDENAAIGGQNAAEMSIGLQRGDKP